MSFPQVIHAKPGLADPAADRERQPAAEKLAMKIEFPARGLPVLGLIVRNDEYPRHRALQFCEIAI
jgi:hypothetical protein